MMYYLRRVIVAVITYAIEKALTDKDKLTGIEVHHILDTLHPKPAAEVAGWGRTHVWATQQPWHNP